MATNNESNTTESWLRCDDTKDEVIETFEINSADDRSRLKQRLFEKLYKKATTCDDRTSPTFYRLLLQLIDLVETPKKKGVDDGEGIEKVLEQIRNDTNSDNPQNNLDNDA